MENESFTTCNLCKTDDAKLAFGIDSFRIVQCNRCGLFYVNPRPDNEKTKEAYSEDYWTGRSECGCRQGYTKHLNSIEHAFRKRLMSISIRERLRRISAYKKCGRILDIGCGTGIFLQVMNQAGYKTYGLEISEFASSFARDNLGLNVFTGTLTEAKFREQFFDIVTMFDVFSHLPDPLSYFSEVNKILDEEGIFVFTTGNYSLLPDSLLKRRWGQPEEHYWRLNNQSLDILLAKSGFQLIRSKMLGFIIPVSPKKLNHIGIPNKVLSFLMRTPVLTDEVMFICKKCDR